MEEIMQTAHELMINGLNQVLDVEQKQVEALAELEERSSRPELKKAFAAHRQQTEKHVERIRQIFADLGELPEQTESKGIKGLIEEVHAFMEENPSPDLVNVFNVAMASKLEAYEISTYEALLRLATAMKHRKAVQLITQILREEQQNSKKLQALSKKIKPERSGMEEQEQPAIRRPRRRRAA
jgi:ferritin-like metal-binding protein YciE